MARTDLLTFNLKDQFDGIHSSNFPDSQLLIVLGGDKEGSVFAADVAKALLAELDLQGISDSAKASLRWLPVADLKIVPSLLRWMVKAFLPSNPKEVVALDWQGDFAKAYSWVDGKANIAIFGKGPARSLLYNKPMNSPTAEEKAEMVVLILQNV